MLKPHLKLIEDIKSEERTFSSLSKFELEEMYKISIASGDFTALRMLTNHNTGIYNYNEREPSWLDSEFWAPIWTLMLTSKPKTIRWDSVFLNDGKKLTDPKHIKLLNAFKYWITATDNPLENGGNIEFSKKTIYIKVTYIIKLINAILLHSKELQLAEYHLLHVDDSFWLSIFSNMATYDPFEGVYRFKDRIKALIDKEATTISDEECVNFVAKYPLLLSKLPTDDLSIYPENRQKSCVWLFKQGYYKSYKGKPKYDGNSAVLTRLILNGKCLFEDINTPNFVEFHLKQKKTSTEYIPINNHDSSIGMNAQSLGQYISYLKLIHTNLDRNDSCTPSMITDTLTINSINNIKGVHLKKTMRTRTQPPSLIFNLIEKCFQFTQENQDELLNQCLTALKEGRSKLGKSNSNKLKPQATFKAFDEAIHSDMSGSERGHWFDTEAINCVTSKWKKKGIKQVAAFDIKTPNRHQRIRNNESLFELFQALEGSVQFLVGAIMARRQDELSSLKPYGNLIPNKNPFSIDDEDYFIKKGKDGSVKAQYNLKFKLKKSGYKGKNTHLIRPIPVSIAKLIWRLEEFNQETEKAGLTTGKLSLFNSLESKACNLSAANTHSFNNNYDAMCDYFETDLVLMDSGEYRRNYIRQHQLRRFFALVFFWSKKKESFDALRWMLGHTDMEHLYHYISESETGAVLNSAKASVLASSVLNKDISDVDAKQLDKLRELLVKRLAGNERAEVIINTLSNTIDDYHESDYETTPHISVIEKNQIMENEVLRLLDNEVISLEPNFFIVTTPNGSTESTFNLTLTFNEIN
ncbi:integrase [Aliivibrio salmonicida]|uniref:Integrase n=1 Tax=Aliivibrio salmonicida (strain LFI1238) TaxID=316275 RepID=B6EIE2_ALISL|nr:hypothetical protein [Aliivibrio salmonicida]AZL84322.1 integrase [Aliivibrio salmonicida]CAQ78653.1 hypothetical protein, putative phage gene [Aliivibrio salmonicida LFI1238]